MSLDNLLVVWLEAQGRWLGPVAAFVTSEGLETVDDLKFYFSTESEAQELHKLPRTAGLTAGFEGGEA